MSDGTPSRRALRSKLDEVGRADGQIAEPTDAFLWYAERAGATPEEAAIGWLRVCEAVEGDPRESVGTAYILGLTGDLFPGDVGDEFPGPYGADGDDGGEPA